MQPTDGPDPQEVADRLAEKKRLENELKLQEKEQAVARSAAASRARKEEARKKKLKGVDAKNAKSVFGDEDGEDKFLF